MTDLNEQNDKSNPNEAKPKKTRSRRGRGEGSVFKRGDGVWVASVSAGYDLSGKRRRLVGYGSSKQEALDELKKLQNEDPNAPALERDKMTVAAWFDHWLEGIVKPQRTDNTYRSYEQRIRLTIKPKLGFLLLRQVQAEHLEKLYKEMGEAGESVRVRELTHAVLRAGFKSAMKKKHIRSSPCDLVDGAPRFVRPNHVPLTQEQTLQLVEASRKSKHRLHALVVLAVSTGARQGELFGLAWEDVDLDAGVMHIRHSLQEINGHFKLKEPKSKASRRSITLPEFASEAMKEHRKRMLAEGRIACPVFCDTEGGYLRKSNYLRKVFKPLLAKAKLPDVRFHDLRHGHATMMIGMGENMKLVQERLGHNQVSVTLGFYHHVRTADHEQAAARIDSAFKAEEKKTKKRQRRA